MTLIDTINELCETYVNPFLTGAFYYYAHPTIVRLEEYYENLPVSVNKRETLQNAYNIGECACGWFTGSSLAILTTPEVDSKGLIALFATIIIGNGLSMIYERKREK